MQVLAQNKVSVKLSDFAPKPLIFVFLGYPAVGKSTLKDKLMSRFPQLFYAVCRDDFRFSILNYNKTKRDYQEEIEPLIRTLERIAVLSLVKKKCYIIIDDAFPDVDFYLSEVFKDYRVYFVDFSLEVSREIAEENNKLRERQVPTHVFDKWEQWHKKIENKILYQTIKPSHVFFIMGI